MRAVTSPANPLIKLFRRALAEGATHEGWLAVEGPLLVDEAIRAFERSERGRAASRCVIRSVLVARSSTAKFASVLARVPADAEVTEAPDPVFERVSSTVTPQGIAALIEITPPAFETVLGLPDVILVAVYGLQDPGNLGTIMRSAGGFGADAVITLKPSVRPHNPKTVRASGGAIFRLPVFASLAPAPFFDALSSAGIRLLAASPNGSSNAAEASLGGPTAILIGNEAAGLPPEIPACERVRIPLRPGVDSLNAAVAAGVLLYETARQRGFRY